VTEYPKHAYEVVKGVPLDVDCIVPVSGDGLVHECFNGLADHPESETALRIPVAPIPAGSANGLCVNILGLKVCCRLSSTFLFTASLHHRMLLMLDKLA
jgi:sphingosine kinase